MSYRVKKTIIGGGVIGCALAYEFSKEINQTGGPIVVIEKNEKVTKGENQSTRNSGVVHAGIYYPKATEPLKARLCVEGNTLLYDFCKTHKVPCIQTGKFVVAAKEKETDWLEELLKTGKENNVPGLEIIDSLAINAREPNIKGFSALYVPSSGIVDQVGFLCAVSHCASENGADFIGNNTVVDISPGSDGFEIRIRSRDGAEEAFVTEKLYNAAGLDAGIVAKMVNPKNRYDILRMRSESGKYIARDFNSVNMNVYPTPHFHDLHGSKLEVSIEEGKRRMREGTAWRTVGAHFTPTFNENGERSDTITIGPVRKPSDKKDDYSTLLEPTVYWEKMRGIMPSLTAERMQEHQTGIMAVAKGNPDFVIERDSTYPNCVHLIGIGSPGFTSALAIAKYVRNLEF